LAYGIVRLLSDWGLFLGLFLGSVIFFFVYLFLALVMKVIEENDIKNLDSMLRGLGVFCPLASLLLEFERKIIGLMVHNKVMRAGR